MFYLCTYLIIYLFTHCPVPSHTPRKCEYSVSNLLQTGTFLNSALIIHITLIPTSKYHHQYYTSVCVLELLTRVRAERWSRSSSGRDYPRYVCGSGRSRREGNARTDRRCRQWWCWSWKIQSRDVECSSEEFLKEPED